MKLLVFGQSGQVARELQAQAEVTALGRQDADLSRPDSCVEIIRRTNADAIINAAAFTAVDLAEEQSVVANIVNGEAPAAMARAAAAKAVPFLHISTDYVFDGTHTKPRKEEDRPAPLNEYGRSKLKGEQGVLAAGGNAAILRTSWVFSAHGSNFVKTMLRLAQSRSSLDIVGDQVGGPTPASAIAAALLKMARAMAEGQKGGLYHFCGGPAVTWKQFAEEIFDQSGHDMLVRSIPTSEYPTPAQRPLDSRLDCTKIFEDFGINMPDWKAGLAQVLQEIKVDPHATT